MKFCIAVLTCITISFFSYSQAIPKNPNVTDAKGLRQGKWTYGLERAFQTAGGRSILMSLWKVDDNATQELMTSFYKNLLKIGNKREAFRKAQASVRAKYPHPYYWGAFVLVGE